MNAEDAARAQERRFADMTATPEEWRAELERNAADIRTRTMIMRSETDQARTNGRIYFLIAASFALHAIGFAL